MRTGGQMGPRGARKEFNGGNFNKKMYGYPYKNEFGQRENGNGEKGHEKRPHGNSGESEEDVQHVATKATQ